MSVDAVTFEGTVLRIDGSTAYVVLRNSLGQEGTAEIDASLLTTNGISLGDDFLFTIHLMDDPATVTLTRIEPRVLTDEEVAEIWEKASVLVDDL
jgi:hypothetical protein